MILSKENLKITPQRISIIEELMMNNEHRECDDIYNDMKMKGVNVSRATLYRTIELLVKNNFVRKLELGDGRARNEYKEGLGHHDHLVCLECGNIEEFIEDEIELLQDKVCEKFNFKLVRHIHQLFGVCSSCQK